MTILVTGITGQLGYDVSRELQERGYFVSSPNHNEMNIIDPVSVKERMFAEKPDIVVHCAAWTNVDLAEDEEGQCRAVNVDGTRNIVDCCKEMGIPIVYISTDYVFKGDGTRPWKIDDPTEPQGVYARSKRDGELIVKQYPKHFIIRISWVFGINGKNFVKTMISLSKSKDSLNVVGDQIGSPTYTKDVAKLICDMIKTEKFGTYHACNTGYCSWAEFAGEIFRLTGANTVVNPISSDQWPSKVNRPKNSRMDTSSLTVNGFNQLPTWQDALKRFIEEYSEND